MRRMLHKCDVDYSSVPKSWNLVGVAQKKPKKKWSRPKINFFSSSRKVAGGEKVLYALWWAKIERSFFVTYVREESRRTST